MKSPRMIPTCALVLLVASLVPAQQTQIVNGSFEADPFGQVPSNWMWTGGLAYVSDIPDDLFPSVGNKYLIVDSSESGPAFPGYGPHAWALVGAVRQTVLRPPGQFCSLSIDWEFLTTELLPSVAFNDFLSIDVINDVTNVLITNVVYIDTGVGVGIPPYTNVPGAASGVITWVPNQSTFSQFTTAVPAPAGFKRAVADLSAVPVGTPMRIEIVVGNGGDACQPSRAYIDRVVISAGQQNYNAVLAAMRVLGSPHVDGLGTSFDWGDDTLPLAPYHMRVSPGQRLTFRGDGTTGLKWALVVGDLVDPGIPTPFGQLNVDVFSGASWFFLVDGFSGGALGTIADPATFVDLQLPESLPFGVRVAVQGAVEQPGGGLALTAATSLEVGAAQLPKGLVAVGGGAATDDGSTNQAFAAFGGGSWPFYGVGRSSVDVNSNGSLSFGGGDATATETESGMIAGPARIAPVWDDFFPPGGGQVRSTQTASTYTVSWTNMQDSATGPHGNNVTVQLYQAAGSTPAGVFTIYFGSTTMDDGLTGISPGGLIPPPPGSSSSNVDWSSLGASLGQRGTIPAGSPKFERFALGDNGQLRDTFDLMSMGGVSRITFVPDGLGGYTYFVGSR